MTDRSRKIVFFLGALGFAIVSIAAVLTLPPLGHFDGTYGKILNTATMKERHVTDVVSAINFDYRGFDTLGEEFILFASVLGVALLLRAGDNREREVVPEPLDRLERRNVPPNSPAMRGAALGLIGSTVAFGIYVVTHGQLTPGGGFQGGVVLATAPLLLYLAGDAPKFKKVAPRTLVEIAEAAGAGAFVVLGLIGLISGAAFLENVLSLGPEASTIDSGGTIPLISLAIGLEVAAGFVILLSTFVEEFLEREDDDR